MNLTWPIVAGILINSALYFAAVLVGSIYFHNGMALKLDMVAIGVTYISYFLQATGIPPKFATAAIGLSVVLGASAGLVLL